MKDMSSENLEDGRPTVSSAKAMTEEREWAMEDMLTAIMDVLPKACIRFDTGHRKYYLDWEETIFVCAYGSPCTHSAGYSSTDEAVVSGWDMLTEGPWIRRPDAKRGRECIEWMGRFVSIKPAPLAETSIQLGVAMNYGLR